MIDQNAKTFFEQLREDKIQIEDEIGAQLDWRELPERRASRIILHRDDSDLDDRKAWDDYVNWMKDTLLKFDLAFRQRAKKLRPDTA